ncbi:MAG: nucleosidase [Corynebacterium sp.]|nr:nucleosidase [Corynebacterium sp.]
MGGMVLIVAATEEESSAVSGYPVLVTGIGTSNCAIELVDYVARERPRHIVNIGTAGSLRGDVGIFEISHVYRHDFDSALIARITGRPCPNEVELPTTGVLPTARLATGDSFVADSATRGRLARSADLVDMEGHVVALVGRRFGIPVTLLKQVSDNADGAAPMSWSEAARSGAPALAEAALTVIKALAVE